MNSLGDAFSAPFQDPGWFGKIVVQGLISLIPIIGWIALYGWMMLALENFRAGRRELPPAGFHLGAGAPVFFVYLIYTVVIAVITSLISAPDNAGLRALGGLVRLVLSLGLLFLAPSIILATARNGFGGGLNIGAIISSATSNSSNSLLGGLMLLVASIIGYLGIIVCFVGLLFTIPYALAITAGVVAWFEVVTSGAGMTPAYSGGYPQPGSPPPPATYQPPPSSPEPPPASGPPPPPPSGPPPPPPPPPPPS